MAIMHYWYATGGYAVPGWTAMAQLFTPPNAYTLTSVSVALKKPPYTPGTVNLSIQGVDELLQPDGVTILNVGTVPAAALSDSFQFFTFDGFNLPVAKDTSYALVLEIQDVEASYTYEPIDEQHLIPMACTLNKFGYEGRHYYKYWHVNGSNWLSTLDWYSIEQGAFAFIIEGNTGLLKPINPYPADGAGPGIDFSNRTLSWQNGGGAISYNIYVGDLICYGGRTETYYVIPEEYVSRFSSKGTPISWRVDAYDGTTTITGDTWTFDPRPGKATNPSPSSGATGVSKGLGTVSWTAGSHATSHKVVLGWYGGVSEIQTTNNYYNFLAWTPLYFDPLKLNTTYYWRIDSVNEWGTTTGDTWHFKVKGIDYPRAVYYYPGVGYYSLIWNYETSTWGQHPPTGEIDVDYEIVPFVNFISNHRRLVACARDRFWYQEA